MLALAGVGAGRALGGAQPIHTSDRALRIADTQLAQLRQQLYRTHTPSARSFAARLATLTAQLARDRQSQQRAQTSTHIKRRTPKR